MPRRADPLDFLRFYPNPSPPLRGLTHLQVVPILSGLAPRFTETVGRGSMTYSLLGGRHRIWNRNKNPARAVSRVALEHEKSAVGHHDVAIAKNAIAHRRFGCQPIGLGLGRTLPFNSSAFLCFKLKRSEEDTGNQQIYQKVHMQSYVLHALFHLAEIGNPCPA
jgi:hypothetical protein